METINLIHGDCLAEMDKLIEQGIKVDAILTDIPYGILNNSSIKWDNIIPFPDMWDRLNKLIKPNGAICLFGTEPFSSGLRMSNIKSFKYDWIWEKTSGSNFATVKYQPMRQHEVISVFSKDGSRVNYYPVMQLRRGGIIDKRIRTPIANQSSHNPGLKPYKVSKLRNPKYRYPSSVQYFNNMESSRGLHPTQKPVALMEYLIKTYTQENELVLDFTAGSFTTAIACINTNRQFIGIELDEKYYNIGLNRVNKHNGLLK